MEAFPVDFAISGTFELLCLMFCGKHGIFVEVCLELPDNKNEHCTCCDEESEIDDRRNDITGACII